MRDWPGCDQEPAGTQEVPVQGGGSQPQQFCDEYLAEAVAQDRDPDPLARWLGRMDRDSLKAWTGIAAIIAMLWRLFGRGSSGPEDNVSDLESCQGAVASAADRCRKPERTSRMGSSPTGRTSATSSPRRPSNRLAFGAAPGSPHPAPDGSLYGRVAVPTALRGGRGHATRPHRPRPPPIPPQSGRPASPHQ